MRGVRPRLLTVTLILACGPTGASLAGCGSSDLDQVKAKVLQFGQAATDHDYKTICGQVLAPALLRRLTATGITCRQAMSVAFDSVHGAVLSIGSAKVHGDRASVITLTAARNQKASLSALELVRTKHGWRISALGSPLKASGGG
jgi:hypothetical protein